MLELEDKLNSIYSKRRFEHIKDKGFVHNAYPAGLAELARKMEVTMGKIKLALVGRSHRRHSFYW